jgi:hypothetical protein
MSLSTSLSSSLSYGSPDYAIRTQAGLTVVKTIPQNYDNQAPTRIRIIQIASKQKRSFIVSDPQSPLITRSTQIARDSGLTGPASILWMLSPSSALVSIFRPLRYRIRRLLCSGRSRRQDEMVEIRRKWTARSPLKQTSY